MPDGKEEEEMLSQSQQLLDFAETGYGSVAIRPLSPWGTCEDLLLASAVMKHGTGNWSTVSGELQARALVLNVSPALFSDEACKCRFLTLNGRFASCANSSTRNDNLENPIPWFEELRKLRVAQLKRELDHYDDSIGSLHRKLKRLKAERVQSTLANNPGGKQSQDVDPSDHDFRKRGDEAQTEKPLETRTGADDKFLSCVSDSLPEKFTDGDSKQESPEVASGPPNCRDDHSNKQGVGTVKVADVSQHANVAEQPDRSSISQLSDSHPSLESSKDYASFTCLDAGRPQALDVVAVPDPPSAARVDPGSSVEDAQNCGAATRTRYSFGEPEGVEKCESSVEANIADAVVDKGGKLHNLELPIGDGSQAELQSDTGCKESETESLSRDRDVLCSSGKFKIDWKEDRTHVQRAHSPPTSPIAASGHSNVKHDDEKRPFPAESSKEPPPSEGLEHTSSGANAMDLLRLAYGSAQDSTPVCTPEPTDPQPQVESETVVDMDSVSPLSKALSAPVSSLSSAAGDFSVLTDKVRQTVPNSSGADNNRPNPGSSFAVNDNRVPTLILDGDLNCSSNDEIPFNAAEGTPGAEVPVPEREVEEPDRNLYMVEESDSIPDESFPESLSVIETMVQDVGQVDPSTSTPGNLSPEQFLSPISQQERGISLGSLPVPVLHTDETLLAIAAQCDSVQKRRFVQGYKPGIELEVSSSDKNLRNEIEGAQSRDEDGNSIVDTGSPIFETQPGSSIEEASKPPNDLALETVKPNRGTIVGADSTPMNVETKVAPDLSEEDGLLRDVMMLKPTKLSNLKKRQMLCNGGSPTGAFRNHMSPKESREFSPDALGGKRVKSEDAMENVTFQPKQVSETAIKEESPPVKPRQFKLRSGRVKGVAKNVERAAAAANEVPLTGTTEASGTEMRDGSGTEALPTQSTCPAPIRKVVPKEDVIGKDSERQDPLLTQSPFPSPGKKGVLKEDIIGKDTEALIRCNLESKTTHEDLVKAMQDWRYDTESQLERKGEIATPANGNDEGSPPSKRVRTDSKALPLLESLHVVGAHRFAPLFKRRQESQDNDRYKCLIRRHMDLNTVTSQLEDGMYAESSEFFRDMLLIFNNALVFYSRDSQEYGAARVLRECVMREMEKTLQTDVRQKISGRATRTREVKKVGELANVGTSATASEGKRRGSLRSSSSDYVGSAAGGDCARAADPGVERSTSSEVENIVQGKELLESEEKERGGISYTRSKSKAKVQASEERKMEKNSGQKHRDLKENGRALGLDDDLGCRGVLSAKKVVQGLRKSSQNSLKLKEQATKNEDSESSSKIVKFPSGTQDATRKNSGGRPPRNSQSTQPSSKGSQLPFHPHKRGRT